MEPTKPEQTAVNDSATSVVSDTRLTQARSLDVLGFTYFVRRGEFIKIGSSITPEARIKGLQTGFPEPLDILVIVPDNIVGEMQAHQKFAHLRTSGEWFLVAPDLLAFIEEIKASVGLLPKPPASTPATVIPKPIDLRSLRKLLARERHGMPENAKPHASNLIEQIDNFNNGDQEQRDRLRPLMDASSRRLQAAMSA